MNMLSYEVGQLVTHRQQPMLAMVTGRKRTSNGLEIYGVRRLADNCEVPDLIILGDALVPVDDDDAWQVAEAEALIAS